MHALLVAAIVKDCRARDIDSDCPATPQPHAENMEHAILALASDTDDLRHQLAQSQAEAERLREALARIKERLAVFGFDDECSVAIVNAALAPDARTTAGEAQRGMAILLREARQYVSDAGNEDDTETRRHADALVQQIDAVLALAGAGE